MGTQGGQEKRPTIVTKPELCGEDRAGRGASGKATPAAAGALGDTSGNEGAGAYLGHEVLAAPTPFLDAFWSTCEDPSHCALSLGLLDFAGMAVPTAPTGDSVAATQSPTFPSSGAAKESDWHRGHPGPCPCRAVMRDLHGPQPQGRLSGGSARHVRRAKSRTLLSAEESQPHCCRRGPRVCRERSEPPVALRTLQVANFQICSRKGTCSQPAFGASPLCGFGRGLTSQLPGVCLLPEAFALWQFYVATSTDHREPQLGEASSVGRRCTIHPTAGPRVKSPAFLQLERQGSKNLS